jgi:dTDP-4-dehydrorhamnose reductase
MSTRLVLFGACGQLGRELCARAGRPGIQLAAFGHAEADITDPDRIAAVLERHEPDVVINAAAYTAVDKAESEPDLAFAVNARAPGLLGKACEAAGVALLHISTDYVFDGSKIGGYVEDDPVAPLGVYGRSKAAGEAAVRNGTHRHVIVRTSWVYGWHGRNFLKTMLRLAGTHDTLRVVADQRGCPTAAADLATALLTAAEHIVRDASICGTYHFAGTGVTTWYDFAQEIFRAAAEHAGRRPTLLPITSDAYPTAAPRPANSELCSDRFARVFGYRAMPWRVWVREVTRQLCEAGEPGP